jgi:hypothetical protein
MSIALAVSRGRKKEGVLYHLIILLLRSNSSLLFVFVIISLSLRRKGEGGGESEPSPRPISGRRLRIKIQYNAMQWSEGGGCSMLSFSVPRESDSSFFSSSPSKLYV